MSYENFVKYTQPEQFQQHAQQSATNQWGTPMATSTQVGSGGYGGHGGMSTSMYSGGRDSGLVPIQQQVLNTISSCGMDQGINIHDLIRTMSQHNQQKVK